MIVCVGLTYVIQDLAALVVCMFVVQSYLYWWSVDHSAFTCVGRVSVSLPVCVQYWLGQLFRKSGLAVM